jgi:hypothetical protein
VFRTTPLTDSPDLGGLAGETVELNDGIAGVAVTVPPVSETGYPEPSATAARATAEAN